MEGLEAGVLVGPFRTPPSRVGTFNINYTVSLTITNNCDECIMAIQKQKIIMIFHLKCDSKSLGQSNTIHAPIMHIYMIMLIG